MTNTGGAPIVTERFVVRELQTADVTPSYLSWLSPQNAKFIRAASEQQTLETLRSFVEQKFSDPDAILFGIFEKETNKHIGNIKYEPIDREAQVAIMGILIGEQRLRGSGIAPEVIRATGKWLLEYQAIDRLELGVDRENQAAISSYERIGFREYHSKLIPATEHSFAMSVDCRAL